MSATTDTTAITNLIAKYAELVDAGDFAAVGALFSHGTFGASAGSVQGDTAVEKLLSGMVIRYEDGTPRTHHVTTNIAVEFDEEAGTAVARSYFTVFQALPDFPLQAIAAGHYRDRFECPDGAWRFAERQVEITLPGDLTHHLRATRE